MTMLNLRCICLILLCLILSSTMAFADEIPVWYKVEQADLVAVGTLSITPNPAASKDMFSELLSIKLHVQEVLKGALKTTDVTLHYASISKSERLKQAELLKKTNKTLCFKP